MANDRGGRKVAKVTFPGRRVTYIRRGSRFEASLSRKIIVRSTKATQDDYCVIVNCRNYEYITGCDIYMCCSMDL